MKFEDEELRLLEALKKTKYTMKQCEEFIEWKLGNKNKPQWLIDNPLFEKIYGKVKTS